jgi:hypothetical protein
MHAGPGRRWVEQDSRLRGVYSRIRTKLKLNKKGLWQWDGGEGATKNNDNKTRAQTRQNARRGQKLDSDVTVIRAAGIVGIRKK